MSDTSYNVPQEKASRLVAAQQRAGERMDGTIVLQTPQPGLTIPEPIGGGGLASTANDYGRFMRMLLNGAQGRDGDADGPEQHWRPRSAGAQDRAAAQRRFQLYRGRSRQMGSRLPDHNRSGAW